MSAIARKLNVALAVVLTSTVFMLLHYSPDQPWDLMLGSFLFSLFACAWALHSGSIWGVMGWHAGWNWLIAVGFELPITGLEARVPALLVRLTPVGSGGPHRRHPGARGELSLHDLLRHCLGAALLEPFPARCGAPRGAGRRAENPRAVPAYLAS